MCKITANNWPLVLMATIFAILLLGVGHPIIFLAYFINGLVLVLPLILGLFLPVLLQSHNRPLLQDIVPKPPFLAETIIFFICQILFFLLLQAFGLFSFLGFFSGLVWLIVIALAAYGALYLFNLKADKLKGKVCKIGCVLISQIVIAFCISFSTAILFAYTFGPQPIFILAFMMISIIILTYLREYRELSKEWLLFLSFALVLFFLSLMRAETGMTKQESEMVSAVPAVSASMDAISHVGDNNQGKKKHSSSNEEAQKSQ
jgi:hypothetical protein